MAGIAALVAAYQRDHGGLPAPSRPTASIPAAVTFPITRLVTRVQIALTPDPAIPWNQWGWADITPWVRQDLGISLTVGRPDESSTTRHGRAVLKLDNRDGRFTRRNPTSPYFGLLSMNTPIWATVDAGSGERTRIEMYVNEWPKTWADKSGADSTVTIQCAGILRRLAQGGVVKSALRRTITGTNATQPFAYWPMEDGAGSTAAASGLSDGPALTYVAGALPIFGADLCAGAVSGLNVGDTGTLSGTIAAVSTTVWSLSLVVNLSSVTAPPIELARLTGGGWMVQVFVVNQTLDVWFWVNGAFKTDIDTVPTVLANGVPYHAVVQVVQNGSNVDVKLRLNGVQVNSATITSATVAAPDRIFLNPLPLNNGSAVALVGHYALYAEAYSADLSRAAVGYVGEQAHVRIARLCAEECVLYESVAAQSPRLGPQRVDALLALLRDAELAGCGALYEKHWGLSYQSVAERYNAPVGLALDFAQGHISGIPEPADDDQRVRNKWTVSRPSGSEYTAEQTTGPMGTGAQGPGTYPDSVSVNVEDDGQLPNQAGWRRHL